MNASALIGAVHKRKPLWDPMDVHHHNRGILGGLWKEVGEEVGLNMIQAKTKWRGLRDYYRQLRRNVEEPSDAQVSSWAHFSEMSFIDGTMILRGERRLIKRESSPHPHENEHEDMDEKWTAPDDMCTDTSGSSNADAPLQSKYNESEKSEDEDDDLHFFKSLLPDIRNLPRAKKLFIRLKIQELILNEIYGAESQMHDMVEIKTEPET